MKKYLFAVLLISGLSASAQDDMPDTRKKNEGFVKVADKDMRADLATFTFSGIDEAVGKEQIKKIPFVSLGTSEMIFEGDGVKAKIFTAPFDAGKHKLDFDEKYLIKIDKKTYYGGYPSVPKTYIRQIIMTIGKDTVVIPPAAYSDLFNLNLSYVDKGGTARSTNAIYKSKDGNKVYLYLFSKDDTGSYEVTFIIQDKKFVRRVLDYGFM
jgi:hypothetical protein